MSAEPAGNWVARLQRFVQAPRERCELCGLAIAADHPHLLDLQANQAVCCCRGCATVLGGAGRFRRIPASVRRLPGFRLTDAEWASLQIPIGLAFLLRSTRAGPLALYPGPAGTTESLLEPKLWAGILADNPALADLEPDVEAVLANRLRGQREYFRVPIDRCFLLVSLIRKHWRGITGGESVWEAIDTFFAELRAAHG
jgi:hypothetical protein